jgi:hypothetical protein
MSTATDRLKEIASDYPLLVIGVVLVLIGLVGLVPFYGDQTFPITEPRQWILFALGLAFIVIDVIRYVLEMKPKASLGKVDGVITQPGSNTHVGNSIDAAGSVEGLGKGHHLWLVVEVGDHKWPKADEVRPDQKGKWQKRIYEDGTGNAFALALFVADAEGHRKIQAWLEIGALIGYHPFEADIPGTLRVARVDGLRKPARRAGAPVS